MSKWSDIKRAMRPAEMEGKEFPALREAFERSIAHPEAPADARIEIPGITHAGKAYLLTIIVKAHRIVNSMSDLFHEEIPTSFVDQVFATMALSPRHVFQVLTKRPERMCEYFETGRVRERIANHTYKLNQYNGRGRRVSTGELWPLPNVWLGVSIENRRFVHRADLLRQTPAAVRFISAEPLLGPLVFDGEYMEPGTGARYGCWTDDAGTQIVGGRYGMEPSEDDSYARNLLPELDLAGIDWIITGGESGSKHRRFDPQWAIDLRDACQHSGTAFFHKQNGGRTPKANGRLLDGRTWDEFPVAALPAPTEAT